MTMHPDVAERHYMKQLAASLSSILSIVRKSFATGRYITFFSCS